MIAFHHRPGASPRGAIYRSPRHALDRYSSVVPLITNWWLEIWRWELICGMGSALDTPQAAMNKLLEFVATVQQANGGHFWAYDGGYDARVPSPSNNWGNVNVFEPTRGSASWCYVESVVFYSWRKYTCYLRGFILDPAYQPYPNYFPVLKTADLTRNPDLAELPFLETPGPDIQLQSLRIATDTYFPALMKKVDWRGNDYWVKPS